MLEVVVRKDGRDCELKYAETLDRAKAIGDHAIETGTADSVRVIDIGNTGTEVAARNLEHPWDR